MLVIKPVVYVKNEILFTGDGSTTYKSGTLAGPLDRETNERLPVEKTTLKINYTVGGIVYTATDDGNGSISGTGLTGSINYNTGAYTLSFTTAPDNNTAIVAEYSSDRTIYTVPEGKMALVYVEVYSEDLSMLQILINNHTYYKEDIVYFIGFKFALRSNDAVKVITDGYVTVFVHGMVV